MSNNSRRTWLIVMAMLIAGWLLPSQALPATPPITVPFDHLTTGFELDGVHRDLPCEACHLNAVFRGTPVDCGSCHTTGSTFNATPKTATHIPTTNNCAACHSTISFRPDVHFDHQEVLGSCVSCHNGTLAQSKGPTHIQTSQACEACHTVLSWAPPKSVDHSQIPQAVEGFCLVCHNGTTASGMPAGHLPTTLECGDCHTTQSWRGANFDHSGIVSGCYSCHNGTKAVGKQGNHMPTTNSCENCHTTGIGTATPSWVPSAFDHTQMTVSTCQTCHSGGVKISTGTVSGQPSNHIPPVPSAIDCGVCHGNTPSAETWAVLAASIPTLHTGLPVNNCLLCHAGETFAGVPAPYSPMSTSGVSPTHAAPLSPPHMPVLSSADCSACHAAAYQTSGFGPATAMSAAKHTFVSGTCITCHEAGRSFYTGSGTPLQTRPADHQSSSDARMVSGDCSACHTTVDWNSNTMPPGHMPNPGNQPCNVCHTAPGTSYATLASSPILHTGITGGCGQCHGSPAGVLTWYNNFTPKSAVLTPTHIPYLGGSDCGSCHITGTYGSFGPMNMTQATHAFVPGSCNTCHEAGLSLYMGAANPALQGRPADHTSGNMAAPNDCGQCHTTANWNSTALPAGHMPNPANQQCTVCHVAAPNNYTTLAPVAVLHTGISSGCNQCHGASSPLTWYNNYTPKDGVLTPPHIPYLAGSDCASCHAANYVAGGFGPTNMSAAKHAFLPTTCDTCHEAGLSFYLGASTPALQGRPPDHLSSGNSQQQTGDCSGCHETTDWNTTALPAGHMPNPGGQQCTVCHTAAPGNYAPLAPIATLHTGISSGCNQCHGGATQLTFYNNNDNPKAANLTPPHIPALNGTDCSSCHATNYVTGGFGPMNMTQSTHSGVGSTCNPCHEAGLSFYMGAANPGLQGRPSDHTSGSMVAPNDCSQCHTTANWNSTALPAGHMPNPAGEACSVCHTAAPSNYTSLASIPVLHTGISGGCSTCHGGSTALTWYNSYTPKDGVLTPSHIPYLAGTDCASCHKANYAAGGFGPMNMSQSTHSYVSTTCRTCHEAGSSFYMGAASPPLQGRPADHTAGQMLAPNDCSLCHTTANWNSTVLPAGHMPNPANQGCAVCHKSAPTDYSTATLAANAVLHTGITSGCISCHGPPTGGLTFYNNFTPKSAALSPVHIPTGNSPCEDCHSTTVFTSFSGTTMTATKHRTMFATIGSTCDACHNRVTPPLTFYGVTNLQTRPTDHRSGSKATADCSQCHTPNNWDGGAQIKAATVAKVVQGPMLRPSTIPQPFGHVGISGSCAGCHNGTAAVGKGSLHVASNDRCENCHTTVAWLPARFDHQSISGRCSGCHDGAHAVGKPRYHVPTSAECSNCHSTVAWQPASFRHSPGLENCRSCHNALIADGVPPNHIATARDCGQCHVTTAWSTVTIPAAGGRLIPGRGHHPPPK